MDYGVRRAAAYLEKVNICIIKGAMARRAAEGGGSGARLVPSIAGAPVALEVIAEPRPGGKLEPITPLGYKTQVRRLPPVLAGLSKADPRRRAAVMFADSWEKLGASGRSCLAGDEPSGGGGVSDGGATTRVKHAARVRLGLDAARLEVEGERCRMITTRLVPRLVLAPQRKGRGGHEIKAATLLTRVCLEGQDMLEILRDHGWSAKANQRKALAEALLEMLDDMADAWGLGRAEKKRLDA